MGRNGTLRNPAAMGRSRLSGKVGAGLDPCGAIQVPFELADGQEREDRFQARVWARRRMMPASSSIVSGDRRPRTAHWKRSGSIGSIRWALCMWRRPTRLSTCWPMAGCCIKRWPAVCGHGAATINRAAPSGSAINCRMSMALIHAEPHLVREHLAPAARPASFRKEMCSIGGIRRPAAACARAVPMISLAALGNMPLCPEHG